MKKSCNERAKKSSSRSARYPGGHIGTPTYGGRTAQPVALNDSQTFESTKRNNGSRFRPQNAHPVQSAAAERATSTKPRKLRNAGIAEKCTPSQVQSHARTKHRGTTIGNGNEEDKISQRRPRPQQIHDGRRRHFGREDLPGIGRNLAGNQRRSQPKVNVEGR